MKFYKPKYDRRMADELNSWVEIPDFNAEEKEESMS